MLAFNFFQVLFYQEREKEHKAEIHRLEGITENVGREKGWKYFQLHITSAFHFGMLSAIFLDLCISYLLDRFLPENI